MGGALRKTTLVFVVLALVSPWALVRAAENVDRETRIAEKLEALRNWKLMDVLDLSQDRAQRVFMILRPFDKRRETLLKERRQVRRSLAAAVRGKAVKGDLKSLARRYLAIGTDLAKLRERELGALEKELTPAEEAKYLLFMDRFHMQIVRMLTRGREGFEPKPVLKPRRGEAGK